MQVRPEAQMDWDQKMRKITINIPELPREFGDIPELGVMITSKDDFPDSSWRDRDSLTLARIHPAETIQLGRGLVGALSSGISQKHVGSIFVVAFQLKQPGRGRTTYLLPETDELRRVGDMSLDILDEAVLESVGAHTTPNEAGDDENIAQGYAFLAASMLKMFTKSPENYEKSWVHINSGYRKFYSKPMPITGVVPVLGVLRQIHYSFSVSEMMKVALYRFLYNANRTSEIMSIQKYLYDIHLSHTGMHVVPIAYKVCLTMNCNPSHLMRVMYAHRFKPQILGLVAAFELMKNTDEDHKRRMWKYGRIFDSSFLSSLQTKTCPKFVYILACVLKESSKAHFDILKIKQLEEVDMEDQAKLQAGAKLIIDAINMHVN